jgi:hypothetical protein
MMQKLSIESGPAEILLQAAWHWFVDQSPTEQNALTDLIKVCREGELELRAEKTTELFRAPKYPPGAQPPPPKITYSNVVIPLSALQPHEEFVFEPEHSCIHSRNPETGSLTTFENITVCRDQVLALRPCPPGLKRRRGGGRASRYDWDVVVAIAYRLLCEKGGHTVKSWREFAAEVCFACEQDGMDPVPDSDTVREKLSIWFGRLRP